jgi:hypothetical protein
MIVVVASRNPESVFRFEMLFKPLGHTVLGVRETAPLLSCIHDPRSGLLVIEDGFVSNSSAHALINRVRSVPGPQSLIPIIRVWQGLVLASGYSCQLVTTVNAPVTGRTLEEAMQSLGLIGER